MKNLNYQAFAAFSIMILFRFAVSIILIVMLAGCSWQGQRHKEKLVIAIPEEKCSDFMKLVYENKEPLLRGKVFTFYQDSNKVFEDWLIAELTLDSEWWSMRFCWMSSGIESYTETPYYRSGASIKESQSDANSIESTGNAAGQIIGGIVKGAVK